MKRSNLRVDFFVTPGDQVFAENVTVNTASNTSSSGRLQAGFYEGIQSVTAVGGADADNYLFAPGSIVGDYEVERAQLTGSISAGSSVYGETLTPGTLTLNGILGGDDVSAGSISINLDGNTSSSGNLRAGTHANIQSLSSLNGFDAGNYDFGGISGDYTVTQRGINAFYGGISVYGENLPLLAASLPDIVDGDVVFGTGVLNTTGLLSSSGNLRAGSHNIIETALDGSDAANYTVVSGPGLFTVLPRPLFGMIGDGTSTYGDELVSPELSLLGAIGGDIVNAQTTINTSGLLSAGGHLRAGTHNGIVSVSGLSGLDGGSYIFVGGSGNYTVAKRAINDGYFSVGTSEYGAALQIGPVSIDTLFGDDVTANIAIDTIGRTSTGGYLKAGFHSDILSVSSLVGADANNYELGKITGDYFVSQRYLEGYIADSSSVYGQALQPGAVTLLTLSGDQVFADVTIDTTGNVSGSGHLKAGQYSGIQTAGTISGADADNYYLGAISSANYIVEKAQLTGSIDTGSSIYGVTLAPGNVTLDGVVFGDMLHAGSVAIDTAGLTSSSGHLRAGYYSGLQSVSSISGADADNYDLGVITGDWTVTPRLLGASIAAGSSVYGDALAPGAATLSGLIDGDQVDPANFVIDTSGLLNTSGNLRAGTHTGIQQLGKLSGLDAANYTTVPMFGDFTPVTADYTVTAKVLDATIAAGSSVYGEALAPGAATLNGVVDGDNVFAGNVTIDTTGFTSTSGFLIAGLHEGIQRLADLAGADAGNYSFAGATGDYTVDKREVGGSIEAASSVYGAGRLTPGVATLMGVLADDIVTGNVGVNSSVSLSSSGRLNAGNYQGIQYIAWLGGADGGNYTAPSIRGDYTITPRVLTTSIQTRSAVYGTPFSPPDVSLFGVITGDNVSTEVTINDSGLRSSSGNIIAGKHVGFVLASSTLSGIDAGNYSFAGASGDYIVRPRALTGTIGSATAVYGDAITTGDLTLTGVVDGDSIMTSGVAISAPQSFYSTGGQLRAGAHRNLQRVSSELFGADAANYTFRGATGDITITPRAITGSLESGTSVYGQRLTPGKLTLTGLLDGDLVSGPVAQVDVSGNTSASGFLNAGSYTGIVSVGSNLGGRDRANYSFAGATGDYEVTQANLNITYTARGAFRQYGAADPAFTGFTSATWLARGETLADVTTGTASFGTDATATTNVGRAGIFGSGLSANSGNYRFNFVQAANNSTALNITQATLNIVATPLSRRYGSENPLLAYTQTGLVNGDTLSGALATTATQTSNVGRYAITLGTLSAGSNYRIRFNGSLLNVTAATLTYNADPVSRPFGTPNPPLTGTVTGFVLDDTLASATTGTLRFIPGTNGVLTPGSYAINGGGLIANNRNYTFVQAAGNATALTVTKP